MAKQQEPVFNAQGTHIHLFNAETGGHWECPADVVEVYLARGWEYCPAPDLSLVGLFDDVPPSEKPEEGDTSFNPADHTVAEINAYLAEHAATAPGEVNRVIELELAGKNRTTVVNPRAGHDSGEDDDEDDSSDPQDPNPGD